MGIRTLRGTVTQVPWILCGLHSCQFIFPGFALLPLVVTGFWVEHLVIPRARSFLHATDYQGSYGGKPLLPTGSPYLPQCSKKTIIVLGQVFVWGIERRKARDELFVREKRLCQTDSAYQYMIDGFGKR
jgi:hypothetical protein